MNLTLQEGLPQTQRHREIREKRGSTQRQAAKLQSRDQRKCAISDAVIPFSPFAFCVITVNQMFSFLCASVPLWLVCSPIDKPGCRRSPRREFRVVRVFRVPGLFVSECATVFQIPRFPFPLFLELFIRPVPGRERLHLYSTLHRYPTVHWHFTVQRQFW